MGRIEEKTLSTKNNRKVHIRTAKPADSEFLIDINLQIVNEKLYMLRQPEEAIYTKEGEIKKIENYLDNEGSLYIVAEIDNEVVGYLDFHNGVFKRTQHAGSFSIYILKKWRQLGIGELLLNELLEWAKNTSLIEKITLAVFSTNERAQALYRKLGFKEEGRCPKDMKLEDGTYMDSVLMYKFV